MPLVDPTPSGTNPATNSYSQFAATYGGAIGGMPAAGGGTPAPGSGSSSSSTPPPLVYVKDIEGPLQDIRDIPMHSQPGYPHTGKVKTQLISEALLKFDKMTAEQQRKTLRLLAIGGFTSSFVPLDKVDDYVKESTLDEGRDAYKNLLETASDYFVGSSLHVTPDDVLRSRVGYRLKGAGVKWDGNLNSFDDGLGSAVKAAEDSSTTSTAVIPKPGSYTTKSSSVDFMNPQDAKNMVRSTLQAELGRDPTQGEYEDFLSAVHAAEASNPSTQTTTSKYVLDKNDNLRLAAQHSTSQQGIGSAGLEQIAYEKAQRQPGWAEWQAMGTYAPALFQALSATVPGV
jgi:hypothetical protein